LTILAVATKKKADCH